MASNLLPRQPLSAAWWHPLIRPHDQVDIFALPRAVDIDRLKWQLQNSSSSCSPGSGSHTPFFRDISPNRLQGQRWEILSPRQEVLLPHDETSPWFAIIRPLDTQLEGKVIAGLHSCGASTPNSCILSQRHEGGPNGLTATFLDFQVDLPSDDVKLLGDDAISDAWHAALFPLSSQQHLDGQSVNGHEEQHALQLSEDESNFTGSTTAVAFHPELASMQAMGLPLLQRQGYYPHDIILQYSTGRQMSFQCTWNSARVNSTQVRTYISSFKQRILETLALCRLEQQQSNQINGTLTADEDPSNAAGTPNGALPNGTHGEDQRVTQSMIMTEDDIQTILNFNRRDIPTAEQTIAAVIHKHALDAPDSLAIDSWDLSITYQDLDERSAALAHQLHRQFGNGDQPILTLFEKSAVGVITKLAILRSGNHYVPVDPGHPLERKKTMAEKAGCSVVLCSPTHVSSAQDLNLELLIVVDTAYIDRCSSEETLSSSIDFSQLQGTCTVLFTSGSSGAPKGVKLGHKAVSTSLQDQGRMLGVRPDSRLLAFASFAFDAHMWDTWVPLLMGATTCIPGAGERMDNLQGYMAQAKISIGLLFPAALGVIDPTQLPDLERFYVGGEQVSAGLVASWSRSGKILGNLYGPTECSVICCANVSLHEDGPNDIGTPIGGRCWIADPDDVDHLLPPGVGGELVVSGDTLADRYVCEPGKTDEAFVTPDWPSWAPQIPRVYRTGDIAVLGADGRMRIRGRKDDQIKLYGHRIERKDLELGIAKCGMHESVPVVEKLEDVASGRQQLICFLVPHGLVSHGGVCTVLFPNAQLEEREAALRARLRDLVPSAWIPHTFVWVTSLPLNSSDKVDRRRLREIYDGTRSITSSSSTHVSAAVNDEAATPPTTDTEALLSEVWAKVLGLDRSRISRTSDFLALGGSSIDAIKVVAECRQRRLTLTTSDIFAHPVLAELALRAVPHGTEEGGGGDPVPRIRTPEPFELL